MILAETVFILFSGLLAGAGLALLLGGVLLAGVLSAVVSTRAAVSGHVLQALRAQ
jgi:hypothetical protein